MNSNSQAERDIQAPSIPAWHVAGLRNILLHLFHAQVFCALLYRVLVASQEFPTAASTDIQAPVTSCLIDAACLLLCVGFATVSVSFACRRYRVSQELSTTLAYESVVVLQQFIIPLTFHLWWAPALPPLLSDIASLILLSISPSLIHSHACCSNTFSTLANGNCQRHPLPQRSAIHKIPRTILITSLACHILLLTQRYIQTFCTILLLNRSNNYAASALHFKLVTVPPSQLLCEFGCGLLSFVVVTTSVRAFASDPADKYHKLENTQPKQDHDAKCARTRSHEAGNSQVPFWLKWAQAPKLKPRRRRSLFRY